MFVASGNASAEPPRSVIVLSEKARYAGGFRRREKSVGMTWKRVATAVVLIPFVVGLVLYASTAVVAVALAAVIVLAMIEYFALGDAIGHRAYRFWTLICAVLLVYGQWAAGQTIYRPLDDNIRFKIENFGPTIDFIQIVLFVFLLGIAVWTLATKRPM